MRCCDSIARNENLTATCSRHRRLLGRLMDTDRLNSRWIYNQNDYWLPLPYNRDRALVEENHYQ